MADIVLVHGAFHGGWCWRDVASALGAAGHRVARPTLTGLADRRHLLSAATDLDTHVDDIVNTVVYEEMHDVVLVCHSYGGGPCVPAADRIADRVAALVLLDALLPIDGLSCLELRERAHSPWPIEVTGSLTVPPPPSDVFGLRGADLARVEALVTPHPVATFTQPVALTGAYDRIGVRHYHRARGYDAPYFDDSAARAEAAGWQVAHHDLVHDMMLTDPEWTVGAILDAVRAAGG